MTKLWDFFKDLVQCPGCGDQLMPQDHGLGCRGCDAQFEIVDDIPVLFPPDVKDCDHG